MAVAEDRDGDFARAERVFGRWVLHGSRAALALLAAGFVVYVTGLLPAHVPLEDLARIWGLPLREFLAAADAPTGWRWLQHVGHGDYVNNIGIAVLSSVVIAAYLRVLPLLGRRERAFAVIAALELVVLLAAASGLLNSISGGH